MKYSLISLDGYNTLFEVEPQIRKIAYKLKDTPQNEWVESLWKRLYKSISQIFDERKEHKLTFISAYELYKKALLTSQISLEIDVSIEEGAKLISLAHANAECPKGTQHFLNKLNQKYKLAILSDSDNQTLFSAIKKNNIKVDIIISSEIARGYKLDISNNVFKYLLDNYEYKSNEILHIGDSKNDIFGANNYGIDSWLFNPFKNDIDKIDSIKVNSLSEIEYRLITIYENL